MVRTSAPRPRSPPPAAGELLSPAVREVVRKRGFTALSDAQEQAIPLLLEGKNLVLVAPTGTGKTESAMLPVFDRLLATAGPGFKAVYVTPLRSLNRDILARMECGAGNSRSRPVSGTGIRRRTNGGNRRSILPTS